LLIADRRFHGVALAGSWQLAAGSLFCLILSVAI